MGLSPEELERIYVARYGPFRHGAAAILGDYERAHDAVQDAFARALGRRDDFRGGSPEAWVWRIVERCALDLQRTRRPVELDERFEPELPGESGDAELAAAVRRLPPRRRLVVFLRYFADLPYAEIARLADIDEGTVGATLAAAHADLRAALEPEEVTR